MLSRVTIPESILYTAVFPRVIDDILISGPGCCYNPKRLGCSLWHVSHGFSSMLKKHLPCCNEPKCRQPALHYCVERRHICCIHASRFGFMHQRRKDGKCLCYFREDFCLNVATKRWISKDEGERGHNVSVSFWKGLLFATFWRKGNATRRFNLSYGRVKNDVDDSESKSALECEPMDYISLLYEFQTQVDQYIVNYKRNLVDAAPQNKKMKK